MPVSYGRSTYAELRNNVFADLQEDAKLGKLSSDQFIGLVLKAEERICHLCNIEEEYRLRYNSTTTDYPLQDRPPITGVSVSGTPITITSTAHKLAVNDNIFVRDVQGAVSANGRFRVVAVTTNTFDIKRFGRITGISADAQPKITSRDHPFVTGDSVTISGVLGATEVNGTFTATKIDKDTFSVDILGAPRNTYTGGGIVVANATNTDTYEGGGRFWKEDEVPTHVGNLRNSSADYNGYIVEVKALSFQDLEEWRRGRTFDFVYPYPQRMAIGYKDGKKYLRLDAKPSDDGDIELLYRMQVIPRNHYDDTMSMSVLLPSEHDGAIEEYVKSKIYAGILRDVKRSVFHEENFKRLVGEFNLRQPELLKKMVYS